MGAGGKIIWYGWGAGAFCDGAYAPVREVLPEGTSAIKHAVHIRNHADIPAADILIEVNGAIKHALHIRSAADIPVTYIPIKVLGTQKHAVHTRNAADIPVAYIPIEGRAASDKKDPIHIANVAGTASGGDGEVRLNLGKRPFGIFGSTHCTASANCGIGTENSHAIGMKGKVPYTYFTT